MRGWEHYRPPVSLSLDPERSEKRSKYRNVKTSLDNVTFDSAKEARRYEELKMLQAAGKIRNLELQPVFKLVVGRVNLGVYRADFQYEVVDEFGVWSHRVEDVKSPATKKLSTYRLKKRLMLACHNIEVHET